MSFIFLYFAGAVFIIMDKVYAARFIIAHQYVNLFILAMLSFLPCILWDADIPTARIIHPSTIANIAINCILIYYFRKKIAATPSGRIASCNNLMELRFQSINVCLFLLPCFCRYFPEQFQGSTCSLYYIQDF